MNYWVNEDKPDTKVTVHKDSCPHGVNLPKQPKDGCWHGPFDTKEEATPVARAIGLNYHECKKCFGLPKRQTEAA